MPVDLAATARDNLARVLESDVAPEDLDLDLDMAGAYGLTSLNKILFLMSVCEESGVPLSAFTEADVAGMHTLGQVIAALAGHVGTAA